MIRPDPGSPAQAEGGIAYRLQRSSRRRTVGITVDPERGVLVRAPLRVSQAQVAQVVREKAAWIKKQQAVFAAQGLPMPPRRYLDGESLPFLGREYQLRVQPARPPGPVRLEDGELIAPVDLSWPVAGRAGQVRLALVRWYRAQAARLLPGRAGFFARALDLPAPRVIIADQKTRWGSCNRKGELRLNWRIVMAPPEIVDYLAAHEVCHILAPSHGPGFWRLVGLLLPDYARRRAELGRLGPRLRL